MSFTRISFDITSACNLKCAHCLREDRKEATYLPIEIFEKALTQSKKYGMYATVFTGGEPLIHPEFIEMVDMVAKHGIFYHIVTNGVRTDMLAKLVEDKGRLKTLQSISMSLDGATEETNDRVRGKGVYRKVMASTAYLKAKGIKFGYKLSINTLNVGELEKFVMDSAKLGAGYMEFSQMHPTPELVKQGLILPRARWNEVDRIVRSLAQIVKVPIIKCAGDFSPFSFYQCSSLQMADVHVDCHGNVCVCCILPYYSGGDNEKDKSVIAGNLAEVDLWDAHKRLVAIIARLNQSKIKKIATGDFSEIDHYPCIYCMKYFNKLDWLKEVDPDNEWIAE